MRDTTDSYLRFSIYNLKRDGVLADNIIFRGSSTWSINGEKIGSISFVLDTTIPNMKRITLSYSYQKGEMKDYNVNIKTTPCNFGGVRYWFSCPYCQKKVACLYGSKLFACRKCHNLSYQSCNKTKGLFYSLSRAWDLEEKAESLYKNKRWQCYYNGLETKRYKRYLDYYNQSERYAYLELETNKYLYTDNR